MDGWRGREKGRAGAGEIWRKWGGIERSGDWKRKGWRQWGMVTERDEASLFLTLQCLSQYDGLPSKRPAGIERCWSLFRLTSWQITLSLFLFFLFFFSARLPGREGEGDFLILVVFRLYQSPKRQMKSWSLLFHDNNHLVTLHIRLNLSYTSLQINLCQPLFDSPRTLSAYHPVLKYYKSPKNTRLFRAVGTL